MMLHACVTLLLLLATETTAVQQRDTRCDDATVLRASCNFALADDPQVLFQCEDTQILAQQVGCYRCVDAMTCRHRYDYNQVGVLPRVHNKDAHTTTVAPSPSSAWPLQKQMAATATIADEPIIESDIVDIDLPFIPDALSMAESAEFNGASVQFSGAARQEVSNWYFMVPAALAMVSLGLAMRSRVLRDRDARFERMGDRDREDEINPFCESLSNPQDDGDDDSDVEIGGRYVVDDEDTVEEHDVEDQHQEDACGDGAVQDVDNDCGFAIVVSSSPSTFST